MPPRKTKAQRQAAAQKGRATRSRNAAKKKAEAEEESESNQPDDASIVKPQFGDFLDVGGDPTTLTPVPSLAKFPEVLSPDVKTQLLSLQKASTRCIKYNLPMNYGYLPLHEVVDEKGEPFTLEWWDTSEPGLLCIADLESREPTPKEVKENENWIGKKYKEVTLYYSLTAEKMGNQTLGEILSLPKVKHIY